MTNSLKTVDPVLNAPEIYYGLISAQTHSVNMFVSPMLPTNVYIFSHYLGPGEMIMSCTHCTKYYIVNSVHVYIFMSQNTYISLTVRYN